MRIKSESYFTIALMAIALSAGVYALLSWDFKTALIPVLCGGAISVLCFFQLLKELKGSVTETARIMDFGFDKDQSTERENLLGAIKYFAILGCLYVSIYIYLLASNQVSATKSILFAAIVVGVVYFIINEVAQEALPDPLLYKILF